MAFPKSKTAPKTKRQKKGLNRRNKAIARSASTEGVEASLASTKVFYKSERWLGKTNRYVADTVQRLARDAKANDIKEADLAQYVGVSTLLHCTDGWSYLGRALQALLCGDANTAVHLAYYAELRAAMSLLGCQGIGVFNKKHVAVTGAKLVAPFMGEQPTHMFVWDSLSHWASLKPSGAFFTKTIRPHLRELGDWLIPVGGSEVFAPQARGWFKQWGMDIKLLAADREARNSASYRPSALGFSKIEAGEAVLFAREIWSALEPNAPGSFEGIDRLILRQSLENRFFQTEGALAKDEPQKFGALVKSVIQHQAFSERIAETWRAFLMREQAGTDPKFMTLSAEEPDDGPKSYYGVVARAVLLLRVATGATSHLFSDAVVTRESIRFWRDEIAVSRGFWNAAEEPDSLTDLWRDVADEFTSLDAFAAGQDHSYHAFGKTCAQSVSRLGSCERVALWSVAAA